MRPLPILLTRPRAAATSLAARLADTGATVLVSPLLELSPMGALPAISGGVLLTSPAAVDAWTAMGGTGAWPAWVVGPETARRAAEAGFDVRGVAADAAALATLVPEDAPPLVHLRGEVQRGDLAGDLRARGRDATDAVIYRQTALGLTAPARALLRAGPTLVPLYSPRTATIFGTECPAGALGHVRAVCLSRAVAEAAPVRPVAMAARPDGQAMESAIRKALAANGG
ncbi:uroporphyrinogen-III synthase [uncultured Jannaschia sp.]|uniref:uroporphyrinogen-III synthase n=1 Tax=uncultured Jannaschia sp. TaxID=293347 RepID=UPI0026035000|nr:uroporphyrinogen-III synthase [uncultured Jannaschia sp.]